MRLPWLIVGIVVIIVMALLQSGKVDGAEGSCNPMTTVPIVTVPPDQVTPSNAQLWDLYNDMRSQVNELRDRVERGEKRK